MELKVIIHSGSEFEETVESFNPVAMNTQLNDHNIYTVVI